MKLAIMQPYFFPYIGYWQLINAVDRFVIYDDVSFINRGWINRNRILINGAPHYITVPLVGASQNKRICDIAMQDTTRWRDKIERSIESAYGRSTCFTETFPEIRRQIRHESNNLAEFLAAHLVRMAAFLGIETEIVRSSRIYGNSELRGEERIVDICEREGASSYVNLPGGRALYNAESFGIADVKLLFLSSRISPYRQRTPNFVPNLSIVDTLVEVGKSGVATRLCGYDLAHGGAVAQ